jgi:hypothetical protein
LEEEKEKAAATFTLSDSDDSDEPVAQVTQAGATADPSGLAGTGSAEEDTTGAHNAATAASAAAFMAKDLRIFRPLS